MINKVLKVLKVYCNARELEILVLSYSTLTNDVVNFEHLSSGLCRFVSRITAVGVAGKVLHGACYDLPNACLLTLFWLRTWRKLYRDLSIFFC